MKRKNGIAEAMPFPENDSMLFYEYRYTVPLFLKKSSSTRTAELS